MNNGKLRIYELSKELDLDNRDLLTICEQLTIAVKSHSSSITEEEATAIRTAAKTYQASAKPAPARKTAPTPDDARNDATLSNQKKQQILEIRRPVQRAEDNLDRPELTGPPTIATTSAPVAAPNSASGPKSSDVSKPSGGEAPKPSKPAQPSKPAEVEKSEIKSEVKAQPKSESSPVIAPPAARPAADPVKAEIKPAVKPASEKPASEKPAGETPPAVRASRPPVEAPAPVKPPARPEAGRNEGRPPREERSSAPKEGGNAGGGRPARPAPALKPVLKTERPTPAGNSGGGNAPSTPRKPVTPGAPNRKPPGERRLDGRPSEGSQANRPQIVELKRPRPGAIDDGILDDDIISAADPSVPMGLKSRPSRPVAPAVPAVELLAKPTPPKARKKVWEDEETSEFPEKSKAAAAKGKRRVVQVEDDDEDDLDLPDDDDSIVSAEQVTISLARPAKPKSMTTNAAPQPTSKVVPSGGRSRSNRFTRNRDRREQNAIKAEKPEIITLVGSVTVQELSQMMAVSDTEIIRNLFMKGIAATVTQTLDVVTATQVAEEMGILVDKVEKQSEAIKVTEMVETSDADSLIRRPPVITIMGHVDHGKTSLLDSIRKTKVAAGEAGGITQHIGAYHVDVMHNDAMQQVVFLDTPGHEAFTAMRARGARVTDIAILVVAADDGVQPQTIEAISHAKAAGVPLVVAINKVDKEAAQPDRVKQELTQYDLLAEDWGGSTIMVPVSATTGQNLDTLLEMLLLVAEVEDLTANPDRPARGTVIEAHLDKGKGSVATLLVQNGTLRVGDIIVAGSSLGKVRAMVDDRGRRVKEASPSFAVEVLGLGEVPSAGDEFQIYQDEKEARAVADGRAEEKRQSRLMAAMSSRRVSLNTISGRAQEGELKELNIVMKADVQGSVEAILGSLKQLPQGEVQVRVLFAAPGEISETDVDLAAASDAVLIGFNTTLATGARQAADRAGVDVREYNIIYALLDDIQGAMEGLLEPELVEEPLGQVEVRAVFSVGKGAVAGCYVQNGKAIRNCKVRVHRGNSKVFEGNLDSLKRMKEDTKEVNAGYECGIGIDNFNAWEEGDIIETYRMITKRRTLANK
jgi:translation initiation factor IF-2